MSGRTKNNNDKLVKMAGLRVTNGNIQQMKQNPMFTAYTYIYIWEFVFHPEENNTSHEI
jgi:hypothetical protein